MDAVVYVVIALAAIAGLTALAAGMWLLAVGLKSGSLKSLEDASSYVRGLRDENCSDSLDRIYRVFAYSHRIGFLLLLLFFLLVVAKACSV